MVLSVRRDVTSVGFTEWRQSSGFIEERRDYSEVNSSQKNNKIYFFGFPTFPACFTSTSAPELATFNLSD